MAGRPGRSGGAREGAGRRALSDEQLRLRGARRWRPLKSQTGAASDGDTQAAASALDEVLIGFFLTWELPRVGDDEAVWDLFELYHPDDLSHLRRHWLRLRTVVCGYWREATIDERRAWFVDERAGLAVVATEFPPAMWQFELLGRGKAESEGAYRRRRGLDAQERGSDAVNYRMEDAR